MLSLRDHGRLPRRFCVPDRHRQPRDCLPSACSAVRQGEAEQGAKRQRKHHTIYHINKNLPLIIPTLFAIRFAHRRTLQARLSILPSRGLRPTLFSRGPPSVLPSPVSVPASSVLDSSAFPSLVSSLESPTFSARAGRSE